MKYYLVHDILCAAMRKGLVLSLPVVLLSGGEWMRGDDSVGSRGKVEVNVDQQSLNETLGAPLINSFDSSISHENTNFTEETLYSRQQNEKAKQRAASLESTQNIDEAKKVIKDVLGLDASLAVKTDFRKASLLQLATHSEQKKSYEEAQKYLSEFLQRYSDDALIPVVLLRQGDLFRKMGAYDLERQKYYDVIKAAPKVSLDGKFDLNYVKQVAFIARSQIADSFYEEAGKLPQYEARDKYANAAEMYYRLAADDEANKRVITLKYIRSLYKQGEYSSVTNAGVNYLKSFEDGPSIDGGEVRYLVLDSSRRNPNGGEGYLAGYRDWFELTPAQTDGGSDLEWRLKAARDLAGELFDSKKYDESLEFYRTLAGLLSGSATDPEEYLFLMLGIKRVLANAEAQEANNVSGFEISNSINPMIVGLVNRAHSGNVQIPLLDSFSNGGSEDSIKGESGDRLPEWSQLKPVIVKSLSVLVEECNKAYTSVLPIYYRMALCAENIPSRSALAHYEKIRVGVIDIAKESKGFDENEVYANQEVKLHVLKKSSEDDGVNGILVCIWNGIPSAGVELTSGDGNTRIKITDYVGLAKLPDGADIHSKSLPLKLVSDMASWRISTLKWRENFNKQVTNIGK
jgi:tetratricopeptide (TPR) repeat protein